MLHSAMCFLSNRVKLQELYQIRNTCFCGIVLDCFFCAPDMNNDASLSEVCCYFTRVNYQIYNFHLMDDKNVGIKILHTPIRNITLALVFQRCHVLFCNFLAFFNCFILFSLLFRILFYSVFCCISLFCYLMLFCFIIIITLFCF